LAINWYSIVYLDRLMVLTGAYGGANTVWTLSVADSSIDTVVLGPAFGANFGKIVALDSVAGTAATALGVNYSAGACALGRSYTKSVELTRPYVRDRDGQADFDAWLQVKRVSVSFRNTAALKIRSVNPGRSDRTVEMDIDPIVEQGVKRAWLNGSANDMRMFVENDTPKPSTISAVEYDALYSPRMAMEIS